MDTIILNVAAKALLVNDEGKVLIVRESTGHDTNTQAHRFGLPGGRLNSGESFLDALKREIMEEAGLEVTPIRPLYVGEWRPTIKGVSHQIVAIFMICKAKTTQVRLSEEHDDFAWIDPKTRGKYEFMDPDDKVIDEYVIMQKSRALS